MTLYTIGYESCDIEDFTAFVAKNKIQEIADVRKNPISRKKGFSKSKLAAALGEKGISYVHYKNLGVPQAWRKEAKEKIITREKMFKRYVDEVLPEHPDDLKDLFDRANKKRVAILCFEADAADCHRYFVAQKLKRKSKGKMKIKDLRVHHEQRLGR